MKLLRSLTDVPSELLGGALSIGNFDGIHRGHARIVARLIEQARQLGGPSIVLTFDPHPVRLLRPETAPPPLMWIEQKTALLDELGADVVVAYPTDLALLSLTPEEFFQSIVQDRLGAKAMVEGPNFYFGRDRKGDVNMLGQFCDQAKIHLEIAPPLEMDGEIVSSSRIRDMVSRGDVEEAKRLLSRPYRIRGMVTHGAQRGASIGFPTANLEAIDTMLPGEGVYAGRAHAAGKAWPAAINIGPNPTFGEHALKVEAHLIGFDGSLYQQPLEVDFLRRLRDIQPFDSVDALVLQLKQDVEEAAKIALE